MYLIKNIKIPYDAGDYALKNKLESLLGLKDPHFTIYKRSLDARKKPTYVYQVLVEGPINGKALKRLKQSVSPHKEDQLQVKNKGNMKTALIVGTGPAGLFTGYALARAGVKVTFIEQGGPLPDRVKAVDAFKKTGLLNPKSNIQFGEGGAGTFSDGKLTSRSKDKRVREIFKALVDHGAPEDILYDHMPHIGTDLLRKVLVRMRQSIIDLGGCFHFNETFVRLNFKGNQVQSLVTDQETYQADHYILALGNSARDTFTYLNQVLDLEFKPFAVGFRIEHVQKTINLRQYKVDDSRLPQASYQLTYSKKDRGLSVYTFCMCPGGIVVPASSEEGRLCVNGMSYHARDGVNANAAVVLSLGPNFFKAQDPLSGLAFQRRIEEKAYRLGGGGYKAPVQRLEDFFLNRPTRNLGEIKPSYKPGYTLTNLYDLYPEPITLGIQEALKSFDQRLHGFAHPDALLTGVETRTSSPVRILRENYTSLRYTNLHPIGEGAGYAGGIVSSALDGLKCALHLLEMDE